MAEKAKAAFRKSNRKPAGRSRGQTAIYWHFIVSFGCGMGLCCLLMAVFALVLAKTPVPLQFVRPMVCVAAAAGAALSGWVLARGFGVQCLLCGLGCGVFYLICLAGATVLSTGALPWQGANAMLPVALLLGGLFGGAAAAMQVGR